MLNFFRKNKEEYFISANYKNVERLVCLVAKNSNFDFNLKRKLSKQYQKALVCSCC